MGDRLRLQGGASLLKADPLWALRCGEGVGSGWTSKSRFSVEGNIPSSGGGQLRFVSAIRIPGPAGDTPFSACAIWTGPAARAAELHLPEAPRVLPPRTLPRSILRCQALPSDFRLQPEPWGCPHRSWPTPLLWSPFRKGTPGPRPVERSERFSCLPGRLWSYCGKQRRGHFGPSCAGSWN